MILALRADEEETGVIVRELEALKVTTPTTRGAPERNFAWLTLLLLSCRKSIARLCPAESPKSFMSDAFVMFASGTIGSRATLGAASDSSSVCC